MLQQGLAYDAATGQLLAQADEEIAHHHDDRGRVEDGQRAELLLESGGFSENGAGYEHEQQDDVDAQRHGGHGQAPHKAHAFLLQDRRAPDRQQNEEGHKREEGVAKDGTHRLVHAVVERDAGRDEAVELACQPDADHPAHDQGHHGEHHGVLFPELLERVEHLHSSSGAPPRVLWPAASFACEQNAATIQEKGGMAREKHEVVCRFAGFSPIFPNLTMYDLDFLRQAQASNICVTGQPACTARP